MRNRLAALAAALATVVTLSVVPGPASAGPGGGVPVFHDRVVKRDRAGDVKGDRSTPIDIRRVRYDHYQLGTSGRLVITVRFAKRVRRGSELNWGSSTGPGGYTLKLRAVVGGGVQLKRGGKVVRKPRIKRVVHGRRVEITIPWKKLGSPGRLVGLDFWAVLFKPPEWSGVDEASKSRAVLD